MAKWKCEICNTEFENFEARGFNHTIYCPLCYYKKLYNQQKEVLDKIKEKVNQYEFISGYYDNNYDGEDTTYSHDTLKEELLELLEEIE